mgnify:CR=1 FL=1
MAVALLIIPKHLRVFCEHQWGCISECVRDWCESAGLSFYRPPQDFCPYPLLYIHIDHGVSTTERSLELGSASSAHPHTCDRHVLSFGPQEALRQWGQDAVGTPASEPIQHPSCHRRHHTQPPPSRLSLGLTHTHTKASASTRAGAAQPGRAHTSSPVCADNPAQVCISELPSGHGRHTEPHRPVCPWA